jgi:hypothetical protein
MLAKQLLKNEILVVSQRLKDIDAELFEILDKEILFKLGKQVLVIQQLIANKLGHYIT